jgi:hypothetical protein
MRTRWLVPMILSFVLAAALASVAWAANPHFRRGGTPTCQDTGTLLVCSGKLAGLGNADLVIDLSSNAEASFACGNPGRRSHQAPGINKVPFTATGSETVSADEIKNGNATFTVFAPQTPPSIPSSAEICPNGNWTTVTLSGIDFSDITLTITQETLLFTCVRPGPVPTDGTSVTLTCTAA